MEERCGEFKITEKLPLNRLMDLKVDYVFKQLCGSEKNKKRLSEGGKVTMPLQETFWSKLYGQVRDPFGIDWQISCSEQ
ncbi:VOC family protein [Domibacillus tundrae]|uniref:VOC family protein n=1 Tax=Domibacillus tundrae TaxID=1587527 RepID=UPI003EBDFF39